MGIYLPISQSHSKKLQLIQRAYQEVSLKKLNGMNKNANTLKVYLIGQIGKNSLVKPNPIKLDTILSEIYNVISQAQALIGGRVIILECENQPKLIALYERHGFKLIETINGSDSLLTMYTSII